MSIGFWVWITGCVVFGVLFRSGFKKRTSSAIACAAWPVWVAVIIIASILDYLEARP